MRISVDATAFDDFRSGVGRRALALWARVVPAAGTDHSFTILVDEALAADFRRAVPAAEIVPWPAGRGRPLARLLDGGRRIRRWMAEHAVDLLHQDTLPPAWPERTVPCIHDLRDLHPAYSRGRLRRLWLARVAPRVLARCPRVLTVSEWMAGELRTRLRLPAELVRVVPNGVDAFRFRAGANELGRLRPLGLAAGRYWLAVGHREPRKNLPFLVEVLSHLRERGVHRPLVVAGRRVAGYDEPERRAAAAGLSGSVRFLDAVDESILPALYAGAAAVLVPSRYEGFGLPVLEALAARSPVLCLDAGPFPEIAGAARCRPEDARAWADALVELEDDRVRAAAVAAGDETVTRFAWEAAAAALGRIHRELMG